MLLVIAMSFMFISIFVMTVEAADAVDFSNSFPLDAGNTMKPGGATSILTLEKGACILYSFTPVESGLYVFQSMENNNNPILWLENSAHKVIDSTDKSRIEGLFVVGRGLFDPNYHDENSDILLRSTLKAGETYYYGVQWSDANSSGTVSIRLRLQIIVTYENTHSGITWNGDGVYNGEHYAGLPASVGGSSLDFMMSNAFNGWYTEPTGGKLITKYSIVDLTENQVLYAQWIPINSMLTTKYTVTYHENGGEWTNASSSHTASKYAGQIYVVDPPEVTCNGYFLAGWSSTETGTSEYQPGDVYRVDSDLNLYAVWSPLPYTIQFDVDGGLPIESVTKYYLQPVGELPKAEKEGYRFLGWYDESAPNGNLISGDSTLNLFYSDEVVTIYAHWEDLVVVSGTCGSDVYWMLDSSETLKIWGGLSAGDINGDAFVNDKDIYLLSEAYVGNITLSDAQKKAADINGDGEITSHDLARIMRHTIDGTALETSKKSGPYQIADYSHWLEDGYRSTANTPWYGYRDKIQAVFIEEGITKIGECCFFNCHNLETVSLPSSVSEIAANAFYNCCYHLETINLPNTLYLLGEGTFQWCQKLKSIVLPDRITQIPDDLFYHCDALEQVTLPKEATQIGASAFSECENLRTVTIPSGVTSIGHRAFFKCNALESIHVESGNRAFSSVDGVLFNQNKTELLKFPASNPVTEYEIPSGVERISYYAFFYCEKLLRVSIPDTVTAIGEGAFYVCRNLDHVILPDTITDIGKDAFAHCEAMQCFRIPDGVASIDGVFYFCVKLKSVVIPSSVKQIEAGTFTSNYQLSDIYYLGTAEQWKMVSIGRNNSLDSVRIHYVVDCGWCGIDYDNLIWILDFDGTLTVNGTGAMENYPADTNAPWRKKAESVKKLAMGDSVVSVGDRAFLSCESLTEVVLVDGSTHIGQQAFSTCKSLTTVTMPRSITKVADHAFSDCSSLATVFYGGTLSEWNAIDIQSGNTSLTDANILCAYSDPTLHFFTSGGQLDIQEKTVEPGKPFGELPVPVWAGYTFDGWYTAFEEGEQVTALTSAEEGDFPIHLYARWSPNMYTLSFDANGGTASFNSKTVVYMSVYGDLPTAEREAVERKTYTFDGWFTEPSGGAQVSHEDTFDQTGNQTLYAHWLVESINLPKVCVGSAAGQPSDRVAMPISLENNSGLVGLMISVYYNSDALKLLSIEDGKLLGNAAFDGNKSEIPYVLSWTDYAPEANTENGTIATLYFQIRDDAKAGDYSISIHAQVIDKDLNMAPFDTENGTVTVNPPTQCNVMFDGNGGMIDGLPIKIINVLYGHALETTPEAGRENYTFTGWYTEREGGEIFPAEEKIVGKTILFAHWEKAGYQVSLDANGGTVSPSFITVWQGQPYGLLPVPEWEKHTFLGWFREMEEGTEVTEDTTVTAESAHSLYAHWKKDENGAVKMTVDFDYQGGIQTITYKEVVSGSPYGSLPDAKWDGHVFLGWYMAPEGGKEITSETPVEKEENHNLYAHWDQPYVTIRFDTNGGHGRNLEKRIVQYGEPYGNLPTDEDVYWDAYHAFSGWFVRLKNGEEKTVSSSTRVPLAEDHTLYARWTVRKIKIILDPNGGTMGKTREFFVEYDGNYGDFLLENNPKKDQFQFTGWYTSDEGGQKVSNLDPLTVADDHVLYAHWRPMTQSVYFDGNDYGGPTKTRIFVQNGKPYGTLAMLLLNPFYQDYTLEGWYTQPNQESKGQQITSQTIVNLDEEQTLYAHVRLKDRFTVTFDLNGVSAALSPESLIVENGSTYGAKGQPTNTLPTPTTGDGYTFLGWYTAREGGRRIFAETSVSLGGDQVLYAHWTGTFTVKLNPNGNGAKVTPDSISIENGILENLPLPIWDGHVFCGWYTQATGGSQVVKSTKIAPAEDMILYAHWKEPVSFDVNSDVYAFNNTASAFEYLSCGPGESYPIPYSVFEMIFGDTVAGKSKYRSMIQNLWGGNCNGMSSTVALLFSNDGINPSDFGKENAVSLLIRNTSSKIGPISGDLESSLRTFIEAMQISQYTEPFSKAYKENRLYQYQLDDGAVLDGLHEAVQTALNKNLCTIIAVGNSQQRAAHALLAYQLESISEMESRLYVYDCNYPNASRYITLKKNAQDQFKDWSYEIGGNYGIWKSGSGSYETIESIWENRGHLYDNHVMLTVNTGNLSITTNSTSGTQEVAKLVDGKLVTESDDIYDVPNLTLTLAGQDSRNVESGMISIYLPVDEYTISVLEEDESDIPLTLQASMVDYNLRAEVTTSASSVTFSVEDLSLTNNVSIHGTADDDVFTVELESGYDGVRMKTVTASGEGVGGDIHIFADEGNQLSISGISEDHLRSLAINSVEILESNSYVQSEAYIIQNVSLNTADETVSVTVNNRESATIVAAVYDASLNGKFITARTQNIPAGAGTFTLDFSKTVFPADCKVRVFLLNSSNRKLLTLYDK